ncbi:hypothetical protein FOZ62_017990, partial [Perkinsus olseni]
AQGENRKVLDFLQGSTEQYIADATEWKRTLQSLSSQVKEIDYERAKAAEMIRGLEASIELRVKEWRDVEARLRREVDIGREKSEATVAEAARCRKKLVGVEEARTVAESNLATIRLEFTRRERELLAELSALTTELADTKEELAQTLDTLNSVDVDEESNHPYLQYGVPVMGPRKLRGEVLCVGCRNRLVYAGYGSRSAGAVPPKLGEVVEDFLLDYNGAKQKIKLRRNLDRAHHEADRRKGHRGGRPMSREDSREARTRPCTREVATPERPVRVRKGVVVCPELMTPNPTATHRGGDIQQQQGSVGQLRAGDQVMPLDVIVSRTVRESAEFLQTAQRTIDSQKEDLAKQRAELERRKSELARRERRYKMKKRKMRRLLREIQSLGVPLDSSSSEMSAGSGSELSDDVAAAQKRRKRSSGVRSRTPVSSNNRQKKRKTLGEGGDSRKTDSSVAPATAGEGSPGAVDPAALQEEKEARAAGAFSSEDGKVLWNKRSRAWIASWKDEATGSLRTKSFNPRKKYEGNVQAARDDAIVFLAQRPRAKSPASSDPMKKESSSLGEDEEEEEEMVDEDESPKVQLDGDTGGMVAQEPESSGGGVVDLGAAGKADGIGVEEQHTWSPVGRPLGVDEPQVEVVECSLVSSSSSSDVSPRRDDL